MRILRTLALFVCFLLVHQTQAQFWKKLKKRAEQAAEETVYRKAEEKTAEKTEKAMDSIFDAPNKVGKKNGGKKRKVTNTTEDEYEREEVYENEEILETSANFSSYSKFDFEAGEKIIAYEDFAIDEIGDLPARWNSSNSAEVVNLSTIDGKWLKISKGKGSFVPDFITQFPENFTLEFDVIFDYDVSLYIFLRLFVLNFSDLENPNYQMDRYNPGKNGAYF